MPGASWVPLLSTKPKPLQGASNRGRLYASTHEEALWPGTGATWGCDGLHGQILSCPLPPGCGSKQFRAAWKKTLLPTIAEFEPEVCWRCGCPELMFFECNQSNSEQEEWPARTNACLSRFYRKRIKCEPGPCQSRIKAWLLKLLLTGPCVVVAAIEFARNRLEVCSEGFAVSCPGPCAQSSFTCRFMEGDENVRIQLLICESWLRCSKTELWR